MPPDSTGAGGFCRLNLNSWPNFGGRFFWISPFRGWSFGPQFLSSCPMGPVLGEVELSGLCVRPTSRRRVCSKRTPRGEPARGNGQEINWQSEPLFSEEVHQMVNFFRKKGLTLPINFLAISSRGFAARCPFRADMTTRSLPDAEPEKFDFA